MKQKLTILTAIFGLLLLSNCQIEEMATETQNTHNEISVARKKFKDFKALPRITGEVLKPQRLTSRGATNPLYDFTIDSTSVTQMIKDGKTYYTMAILRPTSSDVVLRILWFQK